ncbi:MAG: type II toxin-antitoxin system PemK/MazF family toxin [Bryobacteraceae bacterium]
MEISRGQIWWIDFLEPIGSGPGLRRPALIVQHNRLNATRLATVLVIPLTTNERWATARGNVLLPKGTAGLREASVVNVTQLNCVDRMMLEDFQGIVPLHFLAAVDDGLRMILDIECPQGALQ